MTKPPASLPVGSPQNRAAVHTAVVNRRPRWSAAAWIAALSMLVPGAALADQPSVAPVELVPESDSPAPPAPAPVAPRLPPQQGQRVPVPRAPARRPAPPPLPAAAQPAALPPADAQAAPPPAEKSNEPPVEERAQRGVVVVERAGQPVSLGVVLAGDGRILCALSPLASGNDLEAHYADGSVARVKLGHHDRVWDLALLVPQTGRWNEGLSASMRDPVRPDASIHAFTLSRGKPAPVNMVIRGRRNLLGADDASLPNALELGSRVTPLDLGSPIIDEEGRVVGVLARGCAPADKGPCTPVAFGVPNNAIRNFLRNVPASAAPPAAWLGIQGVSESGAFAKGVRILVVHPDSPAEEAKLKGGDESVGDTILAVDGVPVTTPEALAEAIRTHAVGEKVPLTVFGQGKYRQVTVALRTAPDPRAAPKAQPAHQAELPPLADAPSPAPGPRPRAQQR